MRSTQVEAVLADPPPVHAREGGPSTGVWATDADCYRFLSQHCDDKARTLETGLGVSTVLFARWSTDHTCVVHSQQEVDRCLDYCRSRGISTDRVSFEVGFSDEVLSALAPGELDLVLIDGGHGFPMPMIDWYYAGSRLRSGGVLVLDDLGLPAVSQLSAFLDKDPQWRPMDRTKKWVAYQREGSGTLRRDWVEQPFLPRGQSRSVVRRTVGRALRKAGLR